MKVLVTGGTGFIGPKVVHALRSRDHPVRALVREPSRAKQLASWGCELETGDVTDPSALRAAAEGCEAIVHLVSIIKGSPDDFDRVMVGGTQNAIEAAKAAGASRFVLMSALGVNEQNRELVPYFRAKWQMEQSLAASGLDGVVFRPSFVFGDDGGVLPMFVRQVRLAPLTPVVGDGKTRLQPIWVGDVAEFFAQAVDSQSAAGGTFEIGGPEAVTWNEFYARVKRILCKRRGTVHLPVGLVRASAAVLEKLPGAPITRDQLTMLTEGGDNVCDNGPALAAFDVDLVGLDEQIRRAS
ncbi:MAG TPA: NAD(P)H-binding protein [Gaiellaceae bacterium]|nr:NAD(P)H-binding protein [Gaiellaceae bacterium]